MLIGLILTGILICLIYEFRVPDSLRRSQNVVDFVKFNCGWLRDRNILEWHRLQRQLHRYNDLNAVNYQSRKHIGTQILNIMQSFAHSTMSEMEMTLFSDNLRQLEKIIRNDLNNLNISERKANKHTPVTMYTKYIYNTEMANPYDQPRMSFNYDWIEL
jgi:hypothetical protein